MGQKTSKEVGNDVVDNNGEGVSRQSTQRISGAQKGKKVSVKTMYHIREKIGEGSFATVRKCIHRETGEAFALKIINKKNIDPKDLEALQIERRILDELDHGNIVRIHAAFESNQRLYMVMDLLEGGELFDRIVAQGTFSEAQASAVVAQVASALVYIHDRQIVHRDLKPENLLYSSRDMDAEIKIIDFGLAKRAVDGPLSTPCGTPGYVAPEILTDSPAYGPPVDCWSLGVILYILLCGFPPFYDKDQNYKNLYHQIRRCKYSFPSPYWDNVSNPAKDLIRKLLVRDAEQRFSARQILSHEWVEGEAPDNPLEGGVHERLRVLQSRKKFKRAIHAVSAVCKLIVMFSPDFQTIEDVIQRQQVLRRAHSSDV